MAAVLGVHSSQIKTVAVYHGSVILEVFVTALEDDEEPEETLQAAKSKFVAAIVDEKIDLGAPLMNADADGV